MKSSILARGPALIGTVLIKDGEEERAMVQSAVFDCIIQFRNLKTEE